MSQMFLSNAFSFGKLLYKKNLFLVIILNFRSNGDFENKIELGTLRLQYFLSKLSCSFFLNKAKSRQEQRRQIKIKYRYVAKIKDSPSVYQQELHPVSLSSLALF